MVIKLMLYLSNVLDTGKELFYVLHPMKPCFDTRNKTSSAYFSTLLPFFGFKTSPMDMFEYIKMIYYGYYPLDEIIV